VLLPPSALFSAQDRQYIDNALAMAQRTHSVEDVLQLIAGEKVQCWRVTGPKVEGLLVTELVGYPRFYEMFIWLLAGKGMARHAEETVAKLRYLAKYLGCKRVRGLATPELARFLRKTCRAKTLHENVVWEV
jgi:hypothetical protein